MKSAKRLFVPLVVALALAALLAGCAAGGGTMQANSTPATGEVYPEATPALPDEATGGGYGDYDGGPAIEGEDATAGADLGDTPSLTVPQDGRKVILNAELSIEALDFTETCAAIEAAATKAGGYISGTDLYASEADIGARTANYVVKVPAENYRDFMDEIGEAGNVTSRNEASEDVTRQYVDIEARLTALRAQEARLLELMEKSASLKDLLTVQEELTEVQYQIEDYMAAQNTYDHLVAYSTANVYVYEVRQITEVPPEQYGDRLGSAFRESWQNFARFWQEFTIGFVYFLPGILVVVVILVVVLLILRRVMKRRKANPPPAPMGGYPGWGYAAQPLAPPPAQRPEAPKAAASTADEKKADEKKGEAPKSDTPTQEEKK